MIAVGEVIGRHAGEASGVEDFKIVVVHKAISLRIEVPGFGLRHGDEEDLDAVGAAVCKESLDAMEGGFGWWR